MPSTSKSTAYSLDHVTERALERYNIVLTPHDYQKLNEIVQSCQSRPRIASTADTSDGHPDQQMIPLCRFLGQENTDEFFGVQWPRTKAHDQPATEDDAIRRSHDSAKSGLEDHTELICVWNKTEGRVTTLLPKGTVIRSRRDRVKKMR
jgi:hypothetical protein